MLSSSLQKKFHAVFFVASIALRLQLHPKKYLFTIQYFTYSFPLYILGRFLLYSEDIIFLVAS